jgi:6-phosphofructokinase 1
MIDGDFIPMKSSDVSGIIQQGGTILKTARCMEFHTPEGRAKAYQQLIKAEIDAVVVIGGEGSFTGALIFSEEYGYPLVGIPGTIDNDIFGTDYTIGYDTALNTVVEAIDKIKDTASSHGRIFFVEVMGREAGQLAINSGIACGAEVIMIPESDDDRQQLDRFMRKGYHQKETSGIVVVAEGDEVGGALKIAETVRAQYPDIEVRVSILGHMQRGGSPTAKDRVSATLMGVAAVKALLENQKGIMVGLDDEKIVHVPFRNAVKWKHPVETNLLEAQKLMNI